MIYFVQQGTHKVC